MTPLEKLLNENIDRLRLWVLEVDTLGAICDKLGYANRGRNTLPVRRCLERNNIDFRHFRTSRAHSKHEVMVTCPVCSNTFIKNLNNEKDSKKVTCSHSCGNKYFSEKQQYGRHLGAGFNTLVKYNDKLTKYLPTIGLRKECVVCGELEVLDCHHVDEDRNNDDINNLVFLCPTHHAALHRHKSEAVFDAVVNHLDYRDNLPEFISIY
jgi:hypothetical protein